MITIHPHTRLTVDDQALRVIPEDAYLTLVALARQISQGVVLRGTKTFAVSNAPEHVELAQKAIKALTV